LSSQSLVAAGVRPAQGVTDSAGRIYVRPHDIEVVANEPAVEGIVAVVRFIHAAGPQARLTLEQVQNREPVEVEISRTELGSLGIKINELVKLRLRQSHSFDDDYAI
jgi:sulfate/thiosulfate transport system ATP-binding protein